MKHVIRLLAIFLMLAGGVALITLLIDNQKLGEEIAQLESELGRMSIADPDRVYLVEIETPDVPPEVAQHVERVWQFRCYMPPGYDFKAILGRRPSYKRRGLLQRRLQFRLEWAK